MFRPLPMKRLASLKMKLIYGAVICSGIIYIATATILAAKNTGLQDLFDDSNDHLADVANIKSLKLVQVVFRHGDRTPIEHYPSDPYDSRKYWPEGWGQLTKIGKQMQYKLGQYIRYRYNGYLNQTYTTDQMYVQSSDKDRTIQSAMANLAGMWPPTSEGLEDSAGVLPQFVPVHTIDASLDNKIAFTRPCPRYAQLIDQVPYLPSERSVDIDNTQLYQYLTTHTGLKVTSYFNVSDINDILFVQERHNLKLPEWTKEVYPDKLVPLSQRWLKAHTYDNEMLRLRTGPLVTEIVRNFKRVTENPTDAELKILEKLFKTPASHLFVYSGHDTTVGPLLLPVSPLLDALGAFDGKIPPYAASVYLELHANASSSKEYNVKAFYRPDLTKPAKEVPLKRCKSNPCNFVDFMSSMEPYIVDDKEWQLECKAGPVS